MDSRNVRQDSVDDLLEIDDSGFAKMFCELESKISVNQSEKSSHWSFHLSEFDKNRIQNGDVSCFGFGNFSTRSLQGQLYHALAQRLLFSEIGNFWTYEPYQVAKKVAIKQNRNIDVDLLRHVFIFNCLINQNFFTSKLQNVCVIGDGMTNFSSLAVGIRFGRKLVSINLPEVLMVDLIFLMRLGIVSSEAKIAQNKKQLSTYLNDAETRIIFVTASDSAAVRDSGIELFVNVHSFQEMTVSTIDTYFDLIKSNSPMLYCCNREKKILYGGEVTIFDQYPWGKCEVVFDNECPWSKFYYHFGKDMKFKRKLDGKVRHKLVSFQKASN